MLNYITTFIAHHYIVCITMLGTAMIGIIAGALGVFALLRKQSLLGDTISHAALPGIALALLATHSSNPLILLGGGAVAGCIGTALMMLIKRKTTLKNDAVLGIVLSVFFGFGLVLMTVIQQRAIPHQALLNKFLFGSAATLLPADLAIISIIGCITLLCLWIFWKEFTILSFDPTHAHTLGYSIITLDIFLTLLLVMTIVTGLQTIGVILISSMLIAPAAAARQWTRRLSTTVFLAAAIGAFAGILGSLITSYCDHMPTGPVIVVITSALVFISFITAPALHKTRKSIS